MTCPRNGGTSVNGPSAGDRLDRDVLGVAGLRYVIWLEGINDLGACLVSADEVIQGYKEVVERLRAKNIKVIGATLVSSFGSPIGSYGFPKVDTERKKVNNFIRASGLFDAVADFDAATLDPATGAMKASMQPNGTTGGPGSCCAQPGWLPGDGRNHRPEASGAFASRVAGWGDGNRFGQGGPPSESTKLTSPGGRAATQENKMKHSLIAFAAWAVMMTLRWLRTSEYP